MPEDNIEIILKDDLNKLRSQRERRDDASKGESDILKAMQGRIKQGHSTGDQITDFSILHYNADQSKEQKLRDLYNNLRTNEGGLVLVETKLSKKIWDEPEGCFGGGPQYNYITTLELGRIESPYLIFDKEQQTQKDALSDLLVKFKIAAKPGAIFNSMSLSEQIIELTKEPEIVKKDIDILLSFYEEIKNVSYIMFYETNIYLNNFAIHIGTEAVDKFFEDTILNRKYEEDINLRFDREKKLYKEIKDALLDEKVLSQYIKTKADKDEEKRQQQIDEIIYRLFDLNYTYTKQVASIEERIRKIPQRARESARALSMPGEVTAVNEMERDFASYMKIAEFHEKAKLETNSRAIINNLQEGIKLGMHKENKIINLQGYQGVKINIADFANGLAQRYKVQIRE